MDYNSAFEVVQIDASNHTRGHTVLVTSDTASAIREASCVLSPHTVELWRGSQLVGSRRPNGPFVVVADRAPQRILFNAVAPLFRSLRRPRAAA